MQKKYIFSITLLCVFLLSPKAQETKELDLASCRAMAVENSSEVKIAGENLKIAQGQKMAARSAWFPNIEASATGLYKNIDIEQELYLPTMNFDPATGELVPDVVVDPLTGYPVTGADGNPVFNSYAYLPLEYQINGGYMVGVSAQQPLYAGGKIFAGNKMASIGENMANENKALQQSKILFETDKAYYLYLSVSEKVKLAHKYTELLEQALRNVNDSYETGMTNRNEMLKVQVKYNEALLQKQKAESGLKLTRMSLCRIIGLPLDTEIQINDSIGDINFDIQNFNTPQASGRAEYRLLQSQVELAGENIKLVRGDYLPTAGVSVNYNYLSVGIKNSDNFSNAGAAVMGSVQVPIFKFGEGKGKVSAAKAEHTVKQLELDRAADLLQLEIEQARLNCIDAYTRVQMADEALKQADENMRISDDNYQVGMETIVNLLEAKTEWQNAYSNKIDALTDFKIRKSDFLRVSDKLTLVPNIAK